MPSYSFCFFVFFFFSNLLTRLSISSDNQSAKKISKGEDLHVCDWQTYERKSSLQLGGARPFEMKLLRLCREYVHQYKNGFLTTFKNSEYQILVIIPCGLVDGKKKKKKKIFEIHCLPCMIYSSQGGQCTRCMIQCFSRLFHYDIKM